MEIQEYSGISIKRNTLEITNLKEKFNLAEQKRSSSPGLPILKLARQLC